MSILWQKKLQNDGHCENSIQFEDDKQQDFLQQHTNAYFTCVHSHTHTDNISYSTTLSSPGFPPGSVCACGRARVCVRAGVCVRACVCMYMCVRACACVRVFCWKMAVFVFFVAFDQVPFSGYLHAFFSLCLQCVKGLSLLGVQFQVAFLVMCLPQHSELTVYVTPLRRMINRMQRTNPDGRYWRRASRELSNILTYKGESTCVRACVRACVCVCVCSESSRMGAHFLLGMNSWCLEGVRNDFWKVPIERKYLWFRCSSLSPLKVCNRWALEEGTLLFLASCLKHSLK